LEVYVESFAQAEDISDAEAFQRAINTVAERGGGKILTNLMDISFHLAVIGKPHVKIHGLGINESTITTTAHTFHAFTDNNVAVPGFEVHGFTIQGPSAPTGGTHTNRGIFLDAQGSSYGTHNRFSELRFRNLFRGLNVHQASDLTYDNIEGEDLLDSVIYIGEVPANRSSRIRHGRAYAKNCLTYAGGSGGGVSVIAYADDVECDIGTYVTCGPSSGATNLHHALYLRSVQGAEIAKQTGVGQKRGAVLHVFSDAGEPRCTDISATIISEAAANYAGVRVAACDGFTLKSSSRISDSALQGVYLSDCKRPTIEGGVLLANNNVSAVTSSVGSAAIRADACSDFKADGVIAIDDTSTAGQYGQGTFIAFEGICPRPSVTNCKHIFPAGAVGYYFVSHESGSVVTYPVYNDNFQDGPQNFLIESGTAVPAGQGIIKNHTRVSAAASPLLSVAQLRRWRLQGCWNEGSRFAYESDGTNVVFWGSADPVSDSWVAGDRWQRSAPAAGGTTGGRCVTAGSPGVWKAESNLAP
jgi:hypothetical protein